MGFRLAIGIGLAAVREGSLSAAAGDALFESGNHRLDECARFLTLQ
jgi:hypothetical protein